MRKEDCVALLKKNIPEESHPQVNFCLRNGMTISMESVARFEDGFLVVRGREGGTSDEGRAFFIPYDEITYIRIERIVKMGELKKMFGESGYLDAEDRLSGKTADTASDGTQAPAATPAPVGAANDPASIAKQNLLNRIRAARANIAGASGKIS